MTQEQIAWGAGLFEGEGHIKCEERNHGNSYRVGVSIAMTDEDTLITFQEVFGGKINGPYDRGNENWSKFWVWSITTAKDVLNFLESIEPYLHSRRKEKADFTMNVIRNKMPGRARGPRPDSRKTHCKYGHEFTEENTYIYFNKKTGIEERRCITCQRNNVRKSRARKQLIEVSPNLFKDLEELNG